MGGREGMTFWMDSVSCNWTTSTYYLPVLPAWVKDSMRTTLPFLHRRTVALLLNDDKYRTNAVRTSS